MHWPMILRATVLIAFVNFALSSPVGSNETTAAISRIPPEFKLDNMIRGPNTVQIIPFYLNAIRVAVVESMHPFFESTNGFDYSLLDQPPDFFVVASPSIFPHLQHCHIIWAVQTLVEMLHRSHDYQEWSARIMFARGRSWYELGTMSIRQRAGSLDDGSGGSGNASSDGVLSARQLAHNESMTRPLRQLAPAPSTNGDDMQVEAFYLQDAQKLKSLDMFLTVIRAIAILAAADTHELVQAWHYVDEETNLRISMSAFSGVSLKTTYGDIVEGLSFLVEMMVKYRDFREMLGRFFEAMPQRVDYGEIELRKFEPAGMAVAR